MKKAFLFILAILALNVSACRSCNDKPDIKPDVYEAGVVDVVEEQPTEIVISNERWEITLPASWEQQDKDLMDSRGVELLAANKDIETMFVIISNDNEKSFDENAIEYIRSLRSSGCALEYITYTTMNCSKYVVITAIKDGVKGMIWITVDEDNKVGYELSCGGYQKGNDSFMKECESLAASFKLKNLTKCDLK